MKANSSFFTMDTCTDTDKPIVSIEIGNCTPAVFNAAQNSCIGYISLKASATDNECSDAQLSFEYKIDLYNDSKGTYNGFDFRVGPLTFKQLNNGLDPMYHDNPMAVDNKNVRDASGTYPIGTHKICWFVEDSCGNIGRLCQLFEVKDCEAPVANCVGGIQIFQMPVSGCITLLAKDFNKGSFDNCSNQDKLNFFFNGDRTSTSYTVCCEDFIASGVRDELPLELQIWVEDEEGNADYCVESFLFQDKIDACQFDFAYAEISGDLITIKNGINKLTIPDIKVNLYQNSFLVKQSFTSNQRDYYFFYDIIPGLYSMDAHKYNDSLNNVSTLDIIGIEKQIRKIDTFTNPLQFIAADVNNDQELSYEDISEIRRLILGSTNKFNNGIPWKIIPWNIDSMPLNKFSDQIDVDINSYRKYVIDFRVLKMGDINDYASPINYKPLRRTNDSLELKYINRHISKGELFKIDFYSDNFRSIVGFQGTIKINSQKLLFKDFNSEAIIVDKNSLGTKFLPDGLTISWNDVYSRTYAPNTILFSLQFEALEDGDLCGALSFTSDLTPAEAYTDSVLIKNIKMESCDVILNSKETVKENIRIYPNPIKDALHIEFPRDASFPMSLDIYSNDGKLVKHVLLLSPTNLFNYKLDLLSPGIYFLKITNQNGLTVRKFIKTQ